jgi:hypothetical protein
MAVNLRKVRPGDVVRVPYELTITESMQDFWHSAFHSQDRIHTSRPFARTMGLQDKVLPFPLALFLTSSMSHEDAAKVQVGFGAVHYLWPGEFCFTHLVECRMEEGTCISTLTIRHSRVSFRIFASLYSIRW